MRALLAALLLAAAPAFAETLVARQGDDEVRLFDGPCVSAETLARIPPSLRETFRKAQGTFSGQKFFGCWRDLGGAAGVIWEDGDQGIIPDRELKPLNGV